MTSAFKIIILSVITAWTGIAHSQDVHFSQYFNNPLFINPAHAGNGINYVRASVFYRNQWNSVASPFRSQSIAVDKAVNRIGVGAILTNNSAGNDGIRQMNILGNLTYIQPLDKDKANKIAIGMQFGIMQKSFDPSKMKFDSQYTPDNGYDPNAPNGEIFANTRINRPDINAGILFTRNAGIADKKLKPFAGVTMSHLTQPKESFIIDENKLPMKLSVSGGTGIVLGKQIELRPSVLYVKQDQYSEMTMGMLVSFSPGQTSVFQLGGYNRFRDAFVAYAGYQVSNFFLGLSYDINTSRLSESSGGQGGFELSLTYVPKAKSKKAAEKEKDKASDRDEDGVKDSEDECPDLPGFESLNGCPDDDQDRDGVKDKHDKCPEVAGTKLMKGCPDKDNDGITDTDDKCPDKPGPKSNEGCPLSSIDADGDGVPDKIDDCPFIKGTPATGGCPDTDKDGITDAEDDCPYLKGDARHYGCPDPDKSGRKSTIEKLDNVNFETNRAVISIDYFHTVEKALDLLSEDSTATVILSGHTDSEGDAMHNMDLSQGRADAVKKYFITHGVNENRISTVAYGETKPVTENNSPDNKFKNRRVEINIIRESKK